MSFTLQFLSCEQVMRELSRRGLVEAVGMAGPRVRAGWRVVG